MLIPCIYILRTLTLTLHIVIICCYARMNDGINASGNMLSIQQNTKKNKRKKNYNKNNA